MKTRALLRGAALLALTACSRVEIDAEGTGDPSAGLSSVSVDRPTGVLADGSDVCVV